MEYMKDIYGNDIPSLKDTIKFLTECDNPLGDLCRDMLDDEKNFDFNDVDETWWYLNYLESQHGPHLTEPIICLKRIYNTMRELGETYENKKIYDDDLDDI